MELERRFNNEPSVEVRAGDEAGTIHGYAAVFNSLSQMMWGFREQILPGAFDETISDDIRALWNHDTNIVLGRSTAGTLRLIIDERGLAYEIDPPASAASQVESVQRGDVNQTSFGFKTLDDEWSEDEDGVIIRSLKKIKLYEISPVTFPAYTATSAGVRNDEIYGVIPEIPEELRRAPEPSSAGDQARARLGVQKRRLQLLSMR